MNDSIVLGLPFGKCLEALRARRVHKPHLQELQLQPLQIQVYRGPLPLLYGAPAFDALLQLDAIKNMFQNEGAKHEQQQQMLPVHVPAGSLRAVLHGVASQQAF